MNAPTPYTKTSTHPTSMPGKVSGRYTRKKARAGPAPRARALRGNDSSMPCITLYTGRIISGRRMWTSPTMTAAGLRRMPSVCKPSSTSAWLIGPSRPSSTSQAKVRTRMLVR